MTRQAAATAMIAVALSSCARPTPTAADNRDKTPAAVRLAVLGAVNGMPSVAVKGERVVVVWTATEDDTMNVYAAVSEDNGATFSPPNRVNGQDGDVSANAEQPPRVAIGGSNVVVIWPSKKSGESAIRMARSTDGGRTFVPAVTAHSQTLQGARGWESIAAGTDGTVHAVWLDGRDAERMPEDEATMRHSAEGHNHAAMNRGAMDHAAIKAAPRQDVYEAVIGIDGRITEAHVARDVCFCCKTAIAIGPGGRVNVAWRHIFPGSMRDIAMATSTDGGKHFSGLSRVSEDKWELTGCPDDGPAIAVDASDSVHLVWPTFVNQADPQKAIFYTVTKDGRSFAPRIRVSSDDQNDAAHPQIAADPAGNAVIVWDEPNSNGRQVMLRALRAGGGAFDSARPVSAVEGGHHPFIVASGGSFLVAWTSGPVGKSAIMVQRVGGSSR